MACCWYDTTLVICILCNSLFKRHKLPKSPGSCYSYRQHRGKVRKYCVLLRQDKMNYRKCVFNMKQEAKICTFFKFCRLRNKPFKHFQVHMNMHKHATVI